QIFDQPVAPERRLRDDGAHLVERGLVERAALADTCPALAAGPRHHRFLVTHSLSLSTVRAVAGSLFWCDSRLVSTPPGRDHDFRAGAATDAAGGSAIPTVMPALVAGIHAATAAPG